MKLSKKQVAIIHDLVSGNMELYERDLDEGLCEDDIEEKEYTINRVRDLESIIKILDKELKYEQ